MSLINRMLQDLDQRQAVSGGRNGLPEQVVPFHAASGRRRLPILASVLALTLAGAGGWTYWQWQQGALPQLDVWLGGSPVAPPVPAPVAVPVVPPPAAQAAAVPDADGAAPPAAPTPAAESAQASVAPQALLADAQAAPPQPPVPAPTQAQAQAQAQAPAPAPAPAAAPVPASHPAVPVRREAGGAPAVARNEPVASPPPPARIDKTQRQASPAEKAEQHYRMALDLAGRGLMPEAESALRHALLGDPTHGPARQLLVKLLLDQRHVAAAMEVLRDGLDGNPRQTQWAMLLARLELEAGDAGRAWATLERALPAAGRDGEYLAMAGLLQRRLKQPEQAAAYYRQALALVPQEGRWWVGLALSLEESGYGAEAREAFRRALQTGTLSGELQAFAERKLR